MTTRKTIGDTLGPLAGIRIPGGCDDCDAYQTINTDHAPIFIVNVHHDDTCPTYRAMQRSQR